MKKLVWVFALIVVIAASRDYSLYGYDNKGILIAAGAVVLAIFVSLKKWK